MIYLKQNIMLKFINTFILLFCSFLSFAQETNSEVEMVDLMRSNGKIYIVVAVLSVVFAGIVVYLVNLDRKISNIEKRMNQPK